MSLGKFTSIFAILVALVSIFSFSGARKNTQITASVSVPLIVQHVEPVVSSSTRILFVGDMMLGRYVEKLLAQNGESYLFSGTREVFRSANAVVGNLEGPIVYNHIPTLSGGMQFSFASGTANLLARNGVTIVSRANNHGLDRGVLGWADTSQLLQRSHVQYFGSPTQTKPSVSVATTTINNEQIAFVGMNTTFPTFVASVGENLVREVASTTGAFVVISIHWGNEYELEPNIFQKEYARKLILAGADLIIGHHPHVVQSVDEYQGVPIFYSLGNFLFDQYFSKDTQEGLAVMLEFADGVVTYKLLPLESVRSSVSLMSGVLKSQWLSTLAERSPAVAMGVEKGELVIVR
ncbi:MAG: CapA family protein [Candidatus Paceibacterota bacterium]|jgi:poly-gamma-glutamate synthesis protein (capsule biosynthesis protein)